MSDQPEAPKGGTELERVVDGSFANLVFLEDDPEKPGEKKGVERRTKIRKISIQRMDMLGKAWGKFGQEVAVYLDITPEKAATLTDESFETAMQEGRRLNFSSFERWYQWQLDTLKGLGQSDEQKAAVEAATELIKEEMRKRLSGS